ncbi:hypothetical protein Lepto7376_4066 [[Leptolyngbya] sp. PCC 7376]|uniref:hypothetical protein n=1 Tax=[Leptolyngbya] sp. PCC 7376 TaxID=111781 RepID=UPI00029F2D50|nr:hypothetical protein [[Leptolyngbya] sp. PCC 7376]AFY40197.1 hypothetical protein Lepto7376_4066 [[Leptolyngbya] sp. PCC 7376]
MSHTPGHANFSPQQIVCLESPQERLYGSVIQFIEKQKSYWIRPHCLVSSESEAAEVISLHRTSDVIIDYQRVREALDTEILEFWTALYDESLGYEDNVSGRAILHRFLRNFF